MVADEEESGTGRGHECDDVHGAQRPPDPSALPLLTRLLHRSVWQSTMAHPQPVLGIRMFLGFPDPLVTNLASDPSIVKQKL